MAMDDCLDKRIQVYVKGFVFYVEKHIQDGMRDAQIGANPKPGPSVQVASSAAGAAAGLAATQVYLGLAGGASRCAKTGVENIYGRVSSDAKKESARKIEDAFRFINIARRVPVLVEAAGQLFMSYEQTFMSVTGSDKASVWIQLLKLAADAADRLCNHIIANNEVEITVEGIVDAVRSGSSNNSSVLSQVVPDWAKTFISGSERGHCVNVNESEEKTCNVYSSAPEKKSIDEPFEYKLTMANMHSKLESIFKEICAENKELRDVLTYYGVSSSLPADTLKASAKKSSPENAATVDFNAELGRDPDSIIRIVNEMIPVQPAIYTSRVISNRLLLKKELFKLVSRKPDEQDVFVYKGMHESELAELIEPNVFSFSSTQRSIVTCKHIFLQDEVHWDDIVASATKPTHLITKENGDFVLQQSTAVTKLIFRYEADQKRVDSAYISEDELVKQLKSTQKGALLCDVPGMGKTLLMTTITRKYMNESENTIVAFVKLSSTAKDLKGLPSKDDAIKHILGLQFGPKTATLLYDKIQNDKMHVMLFLDGFDEIKDEYVEPATNFLKILNTLDYVQMVISSRPRMRVHLEKIFKLVSFDILPFRKEEQEDAIVDIWHSKHPNLSLEKLRMLAKQCVSSVHNIDQEGMPEILGVPLMCYMLAIINEDYANNFCSPEREEAFEISSLATAVSVCKLYETFIENALKRVEETLACPVNKEKLLSFHTYKALEVLFPDIAKIYMNEKKIDTSIANQSEVSRVGLMQRTGKNCYEFLHMTFAEFLVAKLFAELWSGNIIHGTSFTQVAGICFLQKVISLKCKGFDDAMEHIKFRQSRKLEYSKALKICEFTNSTVLGFMNSLCFNGSYADNQVEPVQRFQKLLTPQITFPMNYRLKLFNFNKKHKSIIKIFKATCYNVVLGCVEECLTSVLGLIVQILIAFQKLGEDPTELLAIPDNLIHEGTTLHNIKNQRTFFGRVVLLYRVAVKGFPEPTQNLFNFFTSLKELCKKFPLEFYSPLEFASVANNVNMVRFFVDRVSVPKERVIVACIFDENIDKQEDMSVRTQIIGLVVGDVKYQASLFSIIYVHSSFQWRSILEHCVIFHFIVNIPSRTFNLQTKPCYLNGH